MQVGMKERLIRLRQEQGLSQSGLAEALGVSRQAVSRWETGAAMPSAENLLCLSRLYGVPMDELIRGEEAEPEQKTEPPRRDTGCAEGGPRAPALESGRAGFGRRLCAAGRYSSLYSRGTAKSSGG